MISKNYYLLILLNALYKPNMPTAQKGTRTNINEKFCLVSIENSVAIKQTIIQEIKNISDTSFLKKFANFSFFITVKIPAQNNEKQHK